MVSYTNLEMGANREEEGDITCPSLSYKQRIMGFAGTLGVALVISILSFVVLFQQNYIMFGVLNTLANVCSLLSSLFLAGPKKQIKKMFDKTRIIATLVYLFTMIMTFIVALVLKIPWLVILCVFIQYLAMLWYGISYIPYARDLIIRIVTAPCK